MAESAQSYASPASASARVEGSSQFRPPNAAEPAGAPIGITPAGITPAGITTTLSESELDATFQLLVERAQYITGATGTALALPRGNDMVCRASAGSCAPKVGACLQVRSGLTGESILRRQLLRCDNAESDPRVNLEACRALGIASIVVLPLFRANGEVRGLIELFADHPYAFEERDLVALERMAALTNTALDLAERNEAIPREPAGRNGNDTKADEPAPAQGAAATSAVAKASPATEVVTGPEEAKEGVTPAQSTSAVSATADPAGPGASTEAQAGRARVPLVPHVAPNQQRLSAAGGLSAGETAFSEACPPESPVATTPDQRIPSETPAAASSPEAPRVEKCTGCGFPVSGGRTLCLDCERKRELEREELARSGVATGQPDGAEQGAGAELVPAFLANAKPVKRSWFAEHVNLLAIAVLILGIAVCIVVFR